MLKAQKLLETPINRKKIITLSMKKKNEHVTKMARLTEGLLIDALILCLILLGGNSNPCLIFICIATSHKEIKRHK